MKILHLSTNDFGGAGSAALRIHNACLKNNLESLLIVKNKTTRLNNVFSSNSKNIISKIKLFLNRVIIRIFYKYDYFMYSLFESDFQNVDEILTRTNFKPDHIILHWTSGFINLDEIIALKKKYGCNVYQYLMDLSPITGGCHYANGCENFSSGCFNCPASKTLDLGQLSSKRLFSQFEKHKELDTCFLSPNYNFKHYIDKSIYKGFKSNNLYIPIDESIFNRKKDLKGNKFKILFGARNIKDKRKGWDFFKEAILHFDQIAKKENLSKKIEIIVPGMDSRNFFEGKHFYFKKTKLATNEKDLSRIYQKVDLFINCSIQDAGPMMISESLMSGVPVISFDVGICSEVIKDFKNGFVVNEFNSRKISEKILFLSKLNENDLENYKEESRNVAINYCSNSSFSDQLKQILRVR
tara:strand:+ start:2851 stop:4083 length:1233 start_codon:yes stop_codon:yes gene_type:complete